MRRHLRVVVVALAITACPGPINTEDAGAGGGAAGGNVGGGNVGGGNVGGGTAGGSALGSRRVLELNSGAARLRGGTLVMDAQLGAPLSQHTLTGGTLRLEGSAVIAP